MLAYIDSSILLKKIFGQTGTSIDLGQITYGVSSELLRVECLRSADRFRIANDESEDDFLQRVSLVHDSLKHLELIQILPEILSRASQSFPASLGTLDAIHLATCLLYQQREGKEITLCSHDEALKRAARAVGLAVLG